MKTFDECKAKAELCSSRTEFFHKFHFEYESARLNGWLTTLFPVKKTRQSSFTLAKCIEIAQGCRTKNELKNKNHHCLVVATRNGWLPYLNLLSPEEARKYGASKIRKYSDEDLANEARKYTTMSDFFKHSHKFYGYAWKRGLLDSFTWLARRDVSAYQNDCVYVYEWPEEKVAYVGRTIYKDVRNNSHHKEGSPVYAYATSNGKPIPEPKYIAEGVNMEEGGKFERMIINMYRDSGWTLLNSVDGGGLGNTKSTKYPKYLCIETARKYEYVQDFYKENGTMYNKMRRCGWLKECTWLKYYNVLKGTYTTISEKEGYEIAKKYSTRSEFMHGNRTLYYAAHREGWIDKWFPESKTASKEVGAFDDNGNLIFKCESIKAAARKVGVKAPCISAMCRGVHHCNHVAGYTWRYI